MTITVVNKRHGATGGTYVGRPSPLGNRYTIGRDGDRAEVIAKYARWLDAQLAGSNPAAWQFRLIAQRAREGDVTLVCWCAPLACHADVIKERLEAALAAQEARP